MAPFLRAYYKFIWRYTTSSRDTKGCYQNAGFIPTTLRPPMQIFVSIQVITYHTKIPKIKMPPKDLKNSNAPTVPLIRIAFDGTFTIPLYNLSISSRYVYHVTGHALTYSSRVRDCPTRTLEPCSPRSLSAVRCRTSWPFTINPCFYNHPMSYPTMIPILYSMRK